MGSSKEAEVKFYYLGGIVHRLSLVSLDRKISDYVLMIIFLPYAVVAYFVIKGCKEALLGEKSFLFCASNSLSYDNDRKKFIVRIVGFSDHTSKSNRDKIINFCEFVAREPEFDINFDMGKFYDSSDDEIRFNNFDDVNIVIANRVKEFSEFKADLYQSKYDDLIT